jgi:hypothetical protein
MGTLLRYPYEVRDEDEYFDDIPQGKVPKDMLDLAKHIVQTKSGHFQPDKFEDHYEEAFEGNRFIHNISWHTRLCCDCRRADYLQVRIVL